MDEEQILEPVTDDLLKEVREKILLKRFNMKMNQQQLSRKAGVSGPTVNHFESGTSINLANLQKIAGAVGMRVIVTVEETN